MATSANTYAGHATNAPFTNEKKDKKGKRDPKSRNKYQYPPSDYVPPSGTLRVHSRDGYTVRGYGRVLQDWSLCMKPKTEPGGGCRNGHFGYFVWSEGVLRKAIWVDTGGDGVCGWVEDVEGEQGSHGDGEGGQDDGNEIIA